MNYIDLFIFKNDISFRFKDEASKKNQDLKYKAVPKFFLPITPIPAKVSGIQEKLQSDKIKLLVGQQNVFSFLVLKCYWGKSKHIGFLL